MTTHDHIYCRLSTYRTQLNKQLIAMVNCCLYSVESP